MRIINIHQAKTHFSKLVDAVMEGESIVIAKAGKPVAKIVPIEAKKPKRCPGSMKGKIKIADDFDAPLPEEILKYFKN